MKLRVIAPRTLCPCTIELPPSKSIANRVLVLSALNGIAPQQVLRQPVNTLCDDIRVMVQLLQSVLSGIDTKADEVLDVGAAGTAMRFATAFLAAQDGCFTITGTERLQQRPIGILVDALRQLGAHIDFLGKEGYPPLRIIGNSKMEGGVVTLDGGVSSQFISALLMIAPKMREGLILHLQGQLVSTPYLYITMQLMRQFGAQVEWTDERTICIQHGYNHLITDIPLIESDWTSASYWYEIAAISGGEWSVSQVRTLCADSLQGDRVCHDIFQQLSERQASHELFTYDFEDCPDLAQTLVVTCCMIAVPFRFTGLRTLRIKETDRISALQTELAKMGFVLKVSDDMIAWDGTQLAPQPSFTIATYHDHRMAMAFAPCALRLGEIIIEDPDVVSKSYPTYWDDLTKLGFTLCHI
ncbi:MAG: 3-phosphoshikimate 1-carboxyvinyltransferase [Bacteroidaceae bacterium]|nr:3-phosphoshikimate 1-carboxyvinyltransferase [Bacteroidaceae bacterium]